MTVLFDYFRDHFEIVQIGKGFVLKLKEAALGAGNFTKAYAMAGGAKDYTTDGNWSPADYPDSDHGAVTFTGQLGDGTDVPYFWVFGKNNVASNGLTRTTGTRLRIQWNSGTLTSIWPADDNGAVLWIPLPACIDLSCQFSIASNGPGQGAANPLRFGIATSDPTNSNPAILADVAWASDTGNQLDETVTVANTAGSLASIDSYVSTGVGRRHYRIEIHGPNIAVFGGAVGASTATTRLHGRSNIVRANRNDLHLYVSLGAAAGTPYAELFNLSLNGKRAVF